MLECTPKRRKGSIILLLLLMIGAIVAVILGVVLVGNNDGSGDATGGESGIGESDGGLFDGETTTPTATPSLRTTSSPTVTTTPTMTSTTSPTGQPSRTSTPTVSATLAPTMGSTTTVPSIGATSTPSLAPATGVPTVSPTVSLRALISQIALQGGEEFDDVNSHQSRALAWLETSNAISDFAPTSIFQRYSLACIYYSTFAVPNDFVSGPATTVGWNRVDGWLSTSDECTWEGVTCNADGQVRALDMANNNLTGNLAIEIVVLAASLTRLDLTDNPIQHVSGNAFLGQLTALRQLILRGTNFQHDDGIPTEIGLLSELRKLDVSYALYSGPLQGSVFANLVNLNTLILSGNEYDSSVPLEIGQLGQLQDLQVEQAGLKGDLTFLSSLQGIVDLKLSKNPNLSGNLPTWIGSLGSLQNFLISDCDMTGNIPSEMGLLTEMLELDLSSNQLNGFIPSELGALVNMTSFLVDDNSLGGFMPDQVCAQVNQGVLAVLEADCVSEVFCSCCTNCL